MNFKLRINKCHGQKCHYLGFYYRNRMENMKVGQTDISIIIPLYMGNRYCYRLLEMIQKNILYKDLYQCIIVEIILINDYPEEKISICHNNLFNIILIEHEKNMGIHASRIEGIQLATGNYIIMLDQDDLIRDNWLYSQWHKITNAKGDYCICNGWTDRFHVIWGNDSEFGEQVNNLDFYVRVNPIVSPGQVIIKKKSVPVEWLENVIKNNGADDYMLWVMALKRGYQFILNEEYLFYHTPERTSDSIDDKKMLESLKEVKEILISNEFWNEVDFQMFHPNLMEIFEKRAMGFLDKGNYILWCTQKRVEIFQNWLELKLKGTNFIQYFKENNIKEIAIYGMGNIGYFFYQEANISGLFVKYGIDKGAKDYEGKLKIYKVEDDLPEVDAVVVTLLRLQEDLLEVLKSKVHRILYFDEIIKELKEREYISRLDKSMP